MSRFFDKTLIALMNRDDITKAEKTVHACLDIWTQIQCFSKEVQRINGPSYDKPEQNSRLTSPSDILVTS